MWIPNMGSATPKSLDMLNNLMPVSEFHAPRDINGQDPPDHLEDTEDARLAEKRIENNDGRATITNAALMSELGLTEEDIADTPIPEME